MKNYQKLAILLLPLAYPLAAQANCGAEFCSLNTDWDIQGVGNMPGVRLDMRAEYIKLDQLRLDQHGELRTINRNYLATVAWNINPTWGVTVKLPLIDRAHKHVHNENDGAGRGANAEPADTGGHSLSVSPGASYRVTGNTHLYGFVQKPIVQYVNGTQLTPDWLAAVGINTTF